MVSFCTLLAEPLTMECDRRVAPAEIIFRSRIKTVTTKDFLKYTPKTPYDNAWSVQKEPAIQRKAWSINGVLKDDKYKTVKGVLSQLHSTTKNRKAFLTSTIANSFVDVKLQDGDGLSIPDRSLSDMPVFSWRQQKSDYATLICHWWLLSRCDHWDWSLFSGIWLYRTSAYCWK